MKHFIIFTTSIAAASAIAPGANANDHENPPVVQAEVRQEHSAGVKKHADLSGLVDVFDEASLRKVVRKLGTAPLKNTAPPVFESSVNTTITYQVAGDYNADIGLVDDQDRYFETKSAGYPKGRYIAYVTSKAGVAISKRF